MAKTVLIIIILILTSLIFMLFLTRNAIYNVAKKTRNIKKKYHYWKSIDILDFVSTIIITIDVITLLTLITFLCVGDL